MKMRLPGCPHFPVGGPLVEKLPESQLELVQAGLHVATHAAVGPRASVLLEQMAELPNDYLELVAGDG